MKKGSLVNFDLVGFGFPNAHESGPRSAESRSQKFSFLKELSGEEMKSYTPNQIATILEQREHLQRILEHETRAKRRAHSLPFCTIRPPPGIPLPEPRNPWIPEDDEECQFKCCQTCRPSCEPRSYLSLDGVLRDDIPPSAAAGFGFHLLGARPVISADIARNLGLRPVPVPLTVSKEPSLDAPSLTPSPSDSIYSSSVWSALDDEAYEQVIETSRAADDEVEPIEGLAHHSPRSSRRVGLRHAITMPWGHHSNAGRQGVFKGAGGAGEATMPMGNIRVDLNDDSDQSSRESLRSSTLTRRDTPDTVQEPMATEGDPGFTCIDFAYCKASPQIGFQPVDMDNGGLVRNALIRATLTPLPGPTPEEEAFLHQDMAPMMQEELREGRFHEEPLDVGDGVAVTEENVGLGLPDIVTQS